jgi:hypothetical protein
MLTDAGLIAYADQQKAIATCYVDGYYKPLAIAQVALGALVGTFGLIRQTEIAADYVDIAREQIAQADRLVVLAEQNYREIAVRAFTCQKELFTRYQSEFQGFENIYLADAFRLQEYVPDYLTQQGRAVASAGSAFDRAQLQARRSVGKFNTGRACFDNTVFAIERALARTAASDRAYRFEESRKFRLDQWYWARRTAGINVSDSMASRVVSGVNGGASVGASGFGNVVNAFGNSQNAAQLAGSALANQGNIFGGLANFGFSNVGYGLGRATTGGQLGGTSAGGFGGGFGGGNGGINTLAGAGFNGPLTNSLIGGVNGGITGQAASFEAATTVGFGAVESAAFSQQ